MLACEQALHFLRSKRAAEETENSPCLSPPLALASSRAYCTRNFSRLPWIESLLTGQAQVDV